MARNNRNNQPPVVPGMRLDGNQVRHQRSKIIYHKIVVRPINLEDGEHLLYLPTLDYFDVQGHPIAVSANDVQTSDVRISLFDENNEWIANYDNARQINEIVRYMDYSIQWVTHGFAVGRLIDVLNVQPTEVPIPTPTPDWKLTRSVLLVMFATAVMAWAIGIPLFLIMTNLRG